MKTFLFAAAAGILLSGCVTPGLLKRMQAYDGPALPDNRVATIRLHDTHANPANLLEKLWSSGITAIDGVPTSGFNVAQVLPGRHRLEMYCWVRNAKFDRAEQIRLEVDVRAGQTYYPWAEAIVTKTRSLPSERPGMIVAEVEKGFCKPYIDDRMADTLR